MTGEKKTTESWRLPRFSLRTLLLVVAGFSVFFALISFVLNSREKAKQVSGANDFMQILLALQLYNDTYHYLPASHSTDASGKPTCSWRLIVNQWLIQFDQAPMPKSDRSWNHPINKRYLRMFSPSDICFCIIDKDKKNPFATHIVAITGPGTAFENGKSCSLNDIPGDTILIVEASNSGLHWAEPGDFDIRTMPQTINARDGKGISGNYRGGFHVGFADGDVWFLRNNTPFDELKKFFTISGAKKYDRDDVLRKYRRNVLRRPVYW